MELELIIIIIIIIIINIIIIIIIIILIIKGNRTPDYDKYTRNKGRNIKNQTNVGSKWDKRT